MQILKNGQITPEALQGLDVTKLSASDAQDLHRVLTKTTQLSANDASVVMRARKASGLSLTNEKTHNGDPIASIAESLAQLKKVL